MSTTPLPEIKPFEGPAPSPDNFAAAYPKMEDYAKGKGKGATTHDPETSQRLAEMHAQMRMNLPKPATIINLLPFPLKVSGGHLFAGIEVPACNPGEPFAYRHIRGYKWDWKQEADENGTFTPIPVFPIQLARAFINEFNGNNSELYGKGVIIYEGDGHPLKVKEVEVYDDLGTPVVEEKVMPVETPEGQIERQRVQVPVRRHLSEILDEARKTRNRKFMQRVQSANHDYNLPDGRGRKNITDVHLAMSAVLVAEGVLREAPKWNLEDRAAEGFDQQDCPVCADPRKSGAIICKGCNYVYEPLKAYEASIIEYGNLAMERMTSDEWEEAEKIREDREKARGAKGQPQKKAVNPNKKNKEKDEEE